MAIVIALMIMVTKPSWAVETKAQMGAVFSTGRQMTDAVDLNASMVFINLMSTHAPYTSLSISNKLNEHFSLAGAIGYGFEEPDEDEGWFYGLKSNFKANDLAINNSVYYYQGLEMWFTNHGLSYPVGFTRIGLNARNFYHTEDIDKASRSYQFGPSIVIPFKDNFSLKLNYFYGYEPEGDQPEDSNVFKATVLISF